MQQCWGTRHSPRELWVPGGLGLQGHSLQGDGGAEKTRLEESRAARGGRAEISTASEEHLKSVGLREGNGLG